FLLMSAMDGGSPRERGPLSTNAAVVVYVHGLWVSGGGALFFRRPLGDGFGVRGPALPLPPSPSPMPPVVDDLQGLVAELKPRRLHFVGHSLGGLVIYRFFERFPRQPPGRVVFLGTPSVASRAAVQASHIRLVANLMGKPVADELLQPHERRWKLADRQLGV